jgi:hypothetical protein
MSAFCPLVRTKKAVFRQVSQKGSRIVLPCRTKAPIFQGLTPVCANVACEVR